MVSAMKCALTLAIIASIACSVYAIRCYSCDSSHDSKCGEKFESQDRNKVDCSVLAPQRSLNFGSFLSRNATGCMKRLFENGPGQHRIERTCYFGDLSQKALGCQPDITQITQRVLSCDVCSGDLCNGSSALAPLGLTVILFFALARLFS